MIWISNSAESVREIIRRYHLHPSPTFADLKSRPSIRGESAAVMERRLKSSLDEIREALWYHYIIFNENLEEAVNRFQAVYIAEMSRRDRWTERIEAFLKEESF